MMTYSVFGGRLRSALRFADLAAAGGSGADWELRIARGAAPEPAAPEVIGTDDVVTGVKVRLLRHAAGFRLVFDDTGAFDVLEGGRTLIWYREPNADEDAARLDVLGRVLPLALHAQQTCVLHGSAVRVGNGAMAFLGPKHHGKSTLAHALSAAGAELLSDDAVPVRTGDVATTLPGVRRVRLWSDSAARFDASIAGSVAQPGDKHLLAPAALATSTVEPVPLVAIYLIEPVPGDAVESVRRMRLGAVEATVALVAQMKLGALLGGSETGPVLRCCAEVADAVAVHRLEVVRDFDRLDDVVAGLLRWHAAATVAA
jgi:hypothetical protein